jgi:DNA-binding transcriptional LysR family regulator
MLETEALRLLVTVADAGSFTAAAAQLNYTQGAVSRAVAGLERQAGGPLFERLPRGVRLNPAGQALYRHAVDVLEHLSRASRELAAIQAGRAGIVRLGAFATANILLVPSALRAFKEARPEVDVVVTEGRSRTLMDGIAQGVLDLAVVSDYPYGLPSTDGVTTHRLCADELLVALPREHPLASAHPIALQDLRDEPWLQAAYGDSPTMLGDACARAGFTPRKIIRIEEWTGKFGYAAAGLGVALVPSLAARAVPAELVLCRLDDPALRRTIHLALPASPLAAALTLRDLLHAAAESREAGAVRPGLPASPAG